MKVAYIEFKRGGTRDFVNPVLSALVERGHTIGVPLEDADVVLWDLRSDPERYPGWREKADYLLKTRKRTFLLPHAPHHDGVETFVPFDPKGESLPDFCEYWMPFIHDRCWQGRPDRKEQFVHVGYPPFDKIEYKHRSQDGPLKLLFVVRPYLPLGKVPGDPYTLAFDEFRTVCARLASAIKQCGRDVALQVKPHPSNDVDRLTEDMRLSGLRGSIIEGPIWPWLGWANGCVGVFSTVLLATALAGIPTIGVWGSTFEHIAKRRNYLERLYELMGFWPVEQLTTALRGIGGGNKAQADAEYIAPYFPRLATARCVERIERVLVAG